MHVAVLDDAASGGPHVLLHGLVDASAEWGLADGDGGGWGEVGGDGCLDLGGQRDVCGLADGDGSGERCRDGTAGPQGGVDGTDGPSRHGAVEVGAVDVEDPFGGVVVLLVVAIVIVIGIVIGIAIVIVASTASSGLPLLLGQCDCPLWCDAGGRHRGTVRQQFDQVRHVLVLLVDGAPRDLTRQHRQVVQQRAAIVAGRVDVLCRTISIQPLDGRLAARTREVERRVPEWSHALPVWRVDDGTPAHLDEVFDEPLLGLGRGQGILAVSVDWLHAVPVHFGEDRRGDLADLLDETQMVIRRQTLLILFSLL
mmetsp:Transcript_17054/g.48451  ORF Transcript_17054/g.48451 Transcript_17054/m.48451 type:complete len:311 (+) Transcript_17054:2324-3256(+)